MLTQAQSANVAYFVSPVGSDANNGSLTAPFASLDHAWRQIPMDEPLSTPITITLLEGTYDEDSLPQYWERRYGTPSAPIVVQGAEGASVRLTGDINAYEVTYITFRNLHIQTGSDVFHCERCDHVTLESNTLIGADPETYAAQETVKFNQSSNVILLSNDISGAWDNAVDFVAVQNISVRANHIHNAGDWCIYAKGGSANVIIVDNLIEDCGTGGFTAGQGTGFQYMVEPYLHYEAYNVVVANNLIRDTYGAGLGVMGGYNIIMAHNTLIRVGARSHVLEVAFGQRSCDGEADDPTRATCAAYAAAGGWGNDAQPNEEATNFVRIPNKHVYLLNNLIYNPAPYRSTYQHLFVLPPYLGDAQTGASPKSAVVDDDLHIAGNWIWNGDPTMSLGIEDLGVCTDTNPTCNVAQLFAQNSINTQEPNLIEEDDVLKAVLPVPLATIPMFSLADAPDAGVTLSTEVVNTLAQLAQASAHSNTVGRLKP
ncbi:MAG: right-handed parallel beta-helix repeat-containing protein [Anaerolineae bacterium]|nr:right-handed parallel beta-helix repeat-containing protein [Anaerolineae bacterium]MDW8171693.1 right-handed parallel beta-helix repeat-containing protein [Anaerolineae bacterium]